MNVVQLQAEGLKSGRCRVKIVGVIDNLIVQRKFGS